MSAPTFGLQAPSSCTDAQPGYTCTTSAVVTNYYSPAICGANCHVEYCFAVITHPPNCATWSDNLPDPLTFDGAVNGTVHVYSQYREVVNGVIEAPSQSGMASIILIDTQPDVTVNSRSALSAVRASFSPS
jgi:hypothetical protein